MESEKYIIREKNEGIKKKKRWKKKMQVKKQS